MGIGWLNDCFGHQSHSMSSFGFLQWKPGYKIFFLNFLKKIGFKRSLKTIVCITINGFLRLVCLMIVLVIKLTVGCSFLFFNKNQDISYLNFNFFPSFILTIVSAILVLCSDSEKMVKNSKVPPTPVITARLQNLRLENILSWFLVIFCVSLTISLFFALLKTVLTIIFTCIVTWWQETGASMSHPRKGSQIYQSLIFILNWKVITQQWFYQLYVVLPVILFTPF